MAHNKLDNLVKVGQLKAKDPAPEEIKRLIRTMEEVAVQVSQIEKATYDTEICVPRKINYR